MPTRARTPPVRPIASGGFGTFRYDPKADRYVWDEAAIKVLGGAVGPQTSYSDILHRIPKSQRKAYEEWRVETIESGQSRSARLPFELPGRSLTLEVFLHRVGPVVEGVVADVTEDEAALERLQSRLRATQFAERLASFGTWAYNIQEDTFEASEGAMRLLLPGGNPATFTFESALDLVAPEFRPVLRQAHDAALHTGQPQQAEFQLTGNTRWFVILFMRILDDEGEPAFTCGTVHDTTDLHAQSSLRETVGSLKEVEAVRARFVNAAAHELSQPLTPMRLELARLASLLPKQKAVAHAFQVVQRNVDRLEYMLKDLLDAARSHAGRLSVNLQQTDLTALVQQVVDTLKPLAQQRGVTLAWESQRIQPVVADPMRLQQCLSNLVHNAIKFTGEGTEVVIEAVEVAGWVRVVVRDHGPGLSKEQQQLLFQPFQQIHQPPSGFTGTGLGLYVTKALMEAMNGSVNVESEPGRGSAFRLEVPLHDPRHP